MLRWLYAMIVCIASSMLGVPAVYAQDQQVRFCMPATAGPEAWLEKATAHGADDCVVVYWTLGDDRVIPVERAIYDDVDVILVVKFPEYDGSIFDAVLRGEFDDEFRELRERIRQAGRPLDLRMYYEANGNWYRWHKYHQSNEPEDFVPAYQRSVNSVKERAWEYIEAFDLNLNRRSAGDRGVSDFEEVLPGDPFYDVVSISTYNRCGTRPELTVPKTFAEEINPAVQTLLRITQRPLAVAETGTSGLCGQDKMVWFRNLLIYVRDHNAAHPLQPIENINFFFERVGVEEASNTVPIYWGVDSCDIPNFHAMLDNYRELAAVGRLEEFPTIPLRSVNDCVTAPDEEDGRRDDADGALFVPGSWGPDHAPWSINGSLTHFLDEVPNTGVSPVTDGPFGEAGTVLRLTARQGLQWNLDREGHWRAGPELSLGLVQSNNSARWWENVGQVGGALVVERDVPEAIADWGQLRLELFGEQRWYTVNTPDRFDGGQEFRAGVRASVIFGGDWRQ